MSILQFIFQTSVFGLTFWLGLYLIARDWRQVRLWLAGLTLATYGLGVAVEIVGQYAPTADLALRLLRWRQFLLLLPAALWLGFLAHLIWQPPTLATLLTRYPKLMSVILVTTIIFAAVLSAIMITSRPSWQMWVLGGLGIDLVVSGAIVVMLDALEQGEVWLPHLLRSLDYSFFTAVLFGGQVVLVMALSTGVQFSLLLLLLTTIAAAIAIQTFAGSFQTMVDNIAFFNFPQVRQTQAELRVAVQASPRVNNALDLVALEKKEFTRLTRRALSNMGNLPKLASSPLTCLPVIEARLAQKEVQAGTLERAAELKLVLSHSIERLKPPNGEAYGTTDEWRYYNALYFPYVMGLKPYSRRMQHDELDTAVQPILDWFRTQVPERTLYNWQNKAARLVAQDLRERSLRVMNGRQAGVL